ASSNASPFAISVALVRTPSRCARIIASFTPRVKPKSSAYRINSFTVRALRSETKESYHAQAESPCRRVPFCAGKIAARRQSNSPATRAPDFELPIEFPQKFSTVLLKSMWKNPSRESNLPMNTRVSALCTTSVQPPAWVKVFPRRTAPPGRKIRHRALPFSENGRKAGTSRQLIPMRRRHQLNFHKLLRLFDVVPFAEGVPALREHLDTNSSPRNFRNLHRAALACLQIQFGHLIAVE